ERAEHDRAPAGPVRDRAADEAEDEDGRVAAEADGAEERRPARQVVDQPAERDLLHPHAQVGDERARPEEEVVARAQDPEHAAEVITSPAPGSNRAPRRAWRPPVLAGESRLQHERASRQLVVKYVGDHAIAGGVAVSVPWPVQTLGHLRALHCRQGVYERDAVLCAPG